ncbi:Clo7bot family Cys-rich peptide [Acinetobacter sp. RIT592]|nr:Clo7bot family Cys-rich peptide [Acinetobacter sp. RIT592]
MLMKFIKKPARKFEEGFCFGWECTQECFGNCPSNCMGTYGTCTTNNNGCIINNGN